MPRALEEEGVFQIGPLIDVAAQKDRLLREYSSVEAILPQRVSDLATSSADHAAELHKIASQRLVEMKNSHRKHLQIWDDFAAKLTPSDTVAHVKKRSSPGVRYYVALRDGRVVARSGEEELYGSIE